MAILFCAPHPTGYLPRHLDGALRAAVGSSPVVILDGPRAVGKTTSAHRLAASVVMLPRDRQLLQADAGGFLRALEPPVLVDEWQLAGTDVLWTVKEIVDEDPSPGRFLLTGSVEPATYGPTYPLTGRAVRLAMRPMTTAELDGHGADPTFLDALVQRPDDKVPAVRTGRRGAAFDLGRLDRPGFPAARHLPDPRHFLDSYASLVAQRAGDEGRDASRLLRTLRVMATLSGQALPDQRVWEAADITKVTWKHYDDLLLRTHVSAPLRALETNRLKRLTAYPKRFLADTALALTLSDLDADGLRADPTVAGHYLEAYAVQQLRPQADLIGATLRHVRTSAGEREVDIAIETAQGVIGVEVKLGVRPGPQDARSLAWLRDHLGSRFHSGLVLHTGQDTHSLADGVVAVPLTSVTGGA
ncbi:MAG: DUF4143 domain-containing protein [Dermatophilaceae bacterium]